MGRKGKGVGYKFTVNDTSDAGEVSGSDDVELVATDTDSDSSTGRKRKYVIAGYRDGRMSSIFVCRKLTRNERLCLMFGGFVLGVLLIIFVLIASIASGRPSTSSPGGGAMEQQPWMNVRLPQNILPEMYNITLHVDLETSSVTGDVSVLCNVTTPTQYVLIHAKDMDISTAHVYQRGNSLDLEAQFLFDDNDFYVLQLQKLLSTGEIMIHLSFNYTLRKDLAGFYRSSYTSLEGTKHNLATTQFEPTDARRAFPCFDEPSFKATFTISISHNDYPQYWAASNMPVSSVVQSGHVTTTHFQTSVKMSTYLVAFVVSDFECINSSINSTNGGRVKTRVCSSPTVANKTDYALKVAGDVLSFYEHEFGVPYPLPKLDLFAIPDFSAGAMENWGLVTYRETALLYDSEADPATSKQRVAVVIAHELAHQWFGDLVTMAWWDGLWLNEGFASFMEYIGTNSTEPDWNMLDQFVVGDLIGALAADSLNESHPILQEVSSPNEINSLFDSISYSKGGSVIRMLKAYLGQDNFKRGITWYLNAHTFGNADTAELWEALDQQAGGKNGMVAQMMDRWTKQMGYPVLTVSQSTGTLSQTRFFAVSWEEENTLPPSPYNYTWYVPFNYITEDHPSLSGQPQMIMESTKSVSWPTDQGWIKVNVDQTGFYRVNYELANWWKLTEHLKQMPNSVKLTPADRAGLLDDVFALSSAGHLGVATAFNFSSYLEGERHYLPWSAAFDWMHTIGDRLSLTPLYGKYKQYLLNLLEPTVQELGISCDNNTSETLPHLQILLRYRLLQTAWQLGHTDVIKNASDLFSKWKNNHPIDPNLKAMVYQVGVAYGSEADWEFMWQRYKNSTDPYEKRLYLRALAQSTEPWILSRYLNYSVTQLRTQDTLSVLVYVSRNVHGRHLAWNFVRNNWNYISETFGGSSFFDRVIRYVTSAFSTELELCEVETFFKQHPNAGSGTRAYHQAIEVIRGNIQWLEANLDILDSCLSNTAQCFS